MSRLGGQFRAGFAAEFESEQLVRFNRAVGPANRLDKAKGPGRMTGPFLINSLTMSYFHTGTRTIIGAKAFHCPVRDGKEWDHLAMVIRLDW